MCVLFLSVSDQCRCWAGRIKLLFLYSVCVSLIIVPVVLLTFIDQFCLEKLYDRTILAQVIHHANLPISTLSPSVIPHLSLIDVRNITCRLLALVWRSARTLTENWPPHLTWVFACGIFTFVLLPCLVKKGVQKASSSSSETFFDVCPFCSALEDINSTSSYTDRNCAWLQMGRIYI